MPCVLARSPAQGYRSEISPPFGAASMSPSPARGRACLAVSRIPYRRAMSAAACLAPDRALIAVSGPDARAFLQGLISNDVNKAAPERAIYAALLTAQGKYLHDFFLAELDGRLLIEAEAARRDDLMRRLARFKLRSQVSIAAEDGLAVALAFGPGAAAALGLAQEPGRAIRIGGGLAFVDPRLTEAGVRCWLPAAQARLPLPDAPAGAYEALRLSLGLPDGSRDLEIEKSILLENGFEELNGVDWQKGCYVGQELTARTHYRALIKKRLVPVSFQGDVPPPGTPVLAGAEPVGEMRSAAGGQGLAMLKLEALGRGDLAAGGVRLEPHPPAWFRPGPAAEAARSARSGP